MEKGRPVAENLRIIWTIAAKDIGDAIKNKTTISIVIGVASLMLAGQAMPLLLKLQAIPRAYYYDAGESSHISDLAKSKDFKLIGLPSQKDMEKVIGESSGSVLGLIIPADFDQRVESRGNVELVAFYVHWTKEEDIEQAVSFFEDTLGNQSDISIEINTEGNTIYPNLDADGQPFMLTLSLVVATITIGAFLVPLLMVEEKEKHTMEALMISPASYGQIVLGKTIAGVSYSLTAAAVVLVLNFSMINHWWLVLSAVLGGALFTVAIGLLVGTIFDHHASMSMALGLILLLLIMPVFLDQTIGDKWSEQVGTIVSWLPSIAMSELVRMSLSNNVILDQILRNLGILGIYTALLLAFVVGRVRGMDR